MPSVNKENIKLMKYTINNQQQIWVLEITVNFTSEQSQIPIQQLKIIYSGTSNK